MFSGYFLNKSGKTGIKKQNILIMICAARATGRDPREDVIKNRLEKS